MIELSDHDLLIRLQREESEDAFAALVHRHTNLVYSVALRHTANPHLAEEITQAVFIIFARKAASLGHLRALSGWFWHTARLTAANFLRSEQRRFRREHEAFMQSTLEEPVQDGLWRDLSPALDEAMARLNPLERDALVLRHFENKSLAEVGRVLGIGERAAQKRVQRALEKIRRWLTQRGIAATTAIIAAEISIHSIQAAPAGLSAKITVSAAKGSAATESTQALVKGTTTVMNWLKTKTALALGAGTVLAIGAGITITHNNRSPVEPPETKAMQEKREAERAGGPVNVAQSPDAQKQIDEARALEAREQALRAQQNQSPQR